MLTELFNRRAASQDELRARDFMKEYEALTERLERIRANYEFAGEDWEIDALIYEENAVLCRLSAMHSKARLMGIHADLTDRPPKYRG